jgi:hypothetical protein
LGGRQGGGQGPPTAFPAHPSWGCGCGAIAAEAALRDCRASGISYTAARGGGGDNISGCTKLFVGGSGGNGTCDPIIYIGGSGIVSDCSTGSDGGFFGCSGSCNPHRGGYNDASAYGGYGEFGGYGGNYGYHCKGHGKVVTACRGSSGSYGGDYGGTSGGKSGIPSGGGGYTVNVA